MDSLHPWASGVFELLLHAEMHLRDGEDFDRRMALVSFDNAIEVAITTYLTLNPVLRGNRQYRRDEVSQWLNNYHTKLDFLESELQHRQQQWVVDRSHIIWGHEHRNEQYHGGQKGIPEKNVLEIVRRSALWIFSVLFDVDNVEELIETAILLKTRAIPTQTFNPPQKIQEYDEAIDQEIGFIEIGNQLYCVSEVLLWVDYNAYIELGAQLCEIAIEEEN